MLETLKVIAILCQVTITSDGGGMYRYTTSQETQSLCQKNLTSCVLREYNTRSTLDFGLILANCNQKR